jgi:hypothetical protein
MAIAKITKFLRWFVGGNWYLCRHRHSATLHWLRSRPDGYYWTAVRAEHYPPHFTY